MMSGHRERALAMPLLDFDIGMDEEASLNFNANARL
jgi:hypothetical protein